MAPTSGTCNLVPPATARIDTSYNEVWAKITGDCASQPSLKAIWYAGRDNELMFATNVVIVQNGDTTPVVPLPPSSLLGTVKWQAWSAVDANGRVYTQNTPQTIIKVISYAPGLSLGRLHGRTTITAVATRVATSLDRDIPYAGETGLIQYRPVGGSTWMGLKDVKTNSSGSYSYAYTTSQVREYRVVFNEAPYVWGSVSPSGRL